MIDEELPDDLRFMMNCEHTWEPAEGSESGGHTDTAICSKCGAEVCWDGVEVEAEIEISLISLDTLQTEVEAWNNLNFPDRQSWEVVVEFGEV